MTALLAQLDELGLSVPAAHLDHAIEALREHSRKHSGPVPKDPRLDR